MADTTVHSFDDILERMDDIVQTVRSKDASLERSLELFDEAIALGSKAVDIVDTFDLSDREAAQLEESMQSDAEEAGE